MLVYPVRNTTTTIAQSIAESTKIYQNFMEFRRWFERENECSEAILKSFDHAQAITESKMYEMLLDKSQN